MINQATLHLLRTEFPAPGERERNIQLLYDQGWWQGEMIQHHKDGSVRHILGSITLIKDENGVPFSVVSVNHDITERKKSEEILQESEEKFRLLMDAAPVAIVITNAMGAINLVNEQTEMLFGYPRTELIGQSVDILVPDTSRVRHATNRATYMAMPRVRRMGSGLELFARRKDGREFPVEIELSYIEIRNGMTVMSFVVDITERKRIAAELEQQRTFLREVIDASPSMIFVKDYDARFVLVNPMVAKMYNTTVEALLGKSDADFNPNATEVEAFLAADRRVITSGEPLFVEEPVTAASGDIHWLQTTKVPVVSVDGKAKFVLGVATDITERKKSEEALQQAFVKEKELSELKSRFVAMASHEFRTPLATILVITETLSAYRHRLPDEQIDQRLDRIKEQVDHLRAIMDDVLLLGRMQAQHIEANRVKLDLDSLCRSVLDEFQSLPNVTHHLEYTCNATLREIRLDRKLMRQVISNLVSNAIKYSPEGKTVKVSLDYADRTLVLKVSDQGIGIPEADLPHLFEPFHRSGNVGTIAGTGLGLAITKESVELHGGTITVESQTGVGTTFTVRIPVVAENEATDI
jgi:PAS domain S-box-containing protein